MSLDKANARCLDNQFDEHMEKNIAQVKAEHEFDQPTPRPMGGTGGVIDLSASFSSSSASNKGGNAAVAAITASTNNSAKKMLFSKKNKGAGLVASSSKKKFTSTKKRLVCCHLFPPTVSLDELWQRHPCAKVGDS